MNLTKVNFTNAWCIQDVELHIGMHTRTEEEIKDLHSHSYRLFAAGSPDWQILSLRC
jgi:hypothetical protein